MLLQNTYVLRSYYRGGWTGIRWVYWGSGMREAEGEEAGDTRRKGRKGTRQEAQRSGMHEAEREERDQSR
jgi:hypothetical protein